MLKKLLAVSIFALSVTASATAFAADPTKEDAMALVAKAKAYMKANGKEKTLEAINTKNGEFHKGELYVQAYNMKGVMIAHPINPKLINLDLSNTPDADGKFFRKDIAALGTTGKTGWVDYKYKNPETGKIEPKTTYIQPVDDVILAAGIYKN